MRGLIRIWLDVKALDRPLDLEVSTRLLADLDGYYARAEPHLRDRRSCKNMREQLEYLALRMHVSFNVSVLCRPAIESQEPAYDCPRHQALMIRTKESLIQNVNAFLDFQAISVVPLRTWSMIHAVLSSTLLLCMWKETQNDAECLDLQRKVVETFISAGKTSNGSADSNLAGNTQWLSHRHIRAVATLQNAFRSASHPHSDATSSLREENRTRPGTHRTTLPCDPDIAGFSLDPGVSHEPTAHIGEESVILHRGLLRETGRTAIV